MGGNGNIYLAPRVLGLTPCGRSFDKYSHSPLIRTAEGKHHNKAGISFGHSSAGLKACGYEREKGYACESWAYECYPCSVRGITLHKSGSFSCP